MKQRVRSGRKQDCIKRVSRADGEMSESDTLVVGRDSGGGKNRDKIDVGNNERSANEKPHVAKKRAYQGGEDTQEVRRNKRFRDGKDDRKVNVSCEEQDVPVLRKHKEEGKMEYAALTGTDGLECNDWTEGVYVSEMNNIDRRVAENVVKLFKEDNTIPFIARYRRRATDGMDADKLRQLKDSYDQARAIQHRAAVIVRAIDKLGKWTPEIHAIIKSAKHREDLEDIYALFKSGSKRSLADRARDLGLGTASDAVLEGKTVPCLSSFVDIGKEGLESTDKVRDGIIHIVSDSIAKDKLALERVKVLRKAGIIEIQTTRSKKVNVPKHDVVKSDNEKSKYEIYFNFKVSEQKIKPHQTLAISRAESQNIIKVKVYVPDAVQEAFRGYCLERYSHSISASKVHSSIILESIDYAYKKFIKPLIVRRVRNDMKADAESASINVFATNVKQLLLTPPVRGNVVLGIDPGFYHGCKLAVVSENGNVLDTAIIYPHRESEHSKREAAKVLIELVRRHRCTLVALGNATACRETELFVATLIRDNSFSPISVSYAIVNEAGASVYSCSSEAKSEFPELDPNLVSAISIARRLQDPMAELVKVEPKHLGVGMYQHDLPEKQLLLTLNEVVSEAVSFVGVDINTASLCLLKRVAGLNASKAKSIIEWRNKRGPFKNREQILRVKGIGGKTFEQCAGFVRVLPETALRVAKEEGREGKDDDDDDDRDEDLNPLDRTWIHPESYGVARDFLNYCGCDAADIGKRQFIDKIQHFGGKGAAFFAKMFSADETTMDVIMNAFAMKGDEDIRSKSELPVFRNGLRSIDDLTAGTLLAGVVRNVTDFGAFVDVGVGRDGLVPSKWHAKQTLGIGRRVEVKVRSIERARNRICLELLRVL